MATVERKPLPPLNSKATTITEADRAEIIARANDVIDYYLDGPGSYFDSGTRKPLAGQPRDDTVADLKQFRNSAIAAKQFADDPNSIMQSVVDLIERTIEQVEQIARNNEGRDRISRPPPNTDDPIDDPRVTSPRAISNAALPISLPLEGEQLAAPPQAGGTPGISDSKPLRILSRRIVDKSPAAVFDTNGSPRSPALFGDRFGNRTSSPESIIPRNPNLPVPPEPGNPLGIFSGKPMPLWTTPLPLGGLLNNSNASGNNDWFDFLAGHALQNPTPPAPSATGGKPERSLGRRIVEPSRASAVDTRAPAAPLAPSDDPNFAGGLLAGLAALAGVDPQNPNLPAAPVDDERDQADLQALEARLSSSGNIRDAVALYNARKSSRR